MYSFSYEVKKTGQAARIDLQIAEQAKRSSFATIPSHQTFARNAWKIIQTRQNNL
jgi:hypothetical protein